jgi:hypothetical protein
VKALVVFRPLIGLIMLLAVVQLACGQVLPGQPTPIPTVPAQATIVTQAPGQESQAGGQATQAAPTAPAASPSAGGKGTPAQAEAMLQAAVQDYQTAGREQALKDFNEKKPPFGTADLYVVCLGEDHKITALGAFPLLVGTSADSLKDSNGAPLGQAVWDAATIVPQGEVPFHWQNPLTGQQESKVLVYQKLSQDVCGVAADQP